MIGSSSGLFGLGPGSRFSVEVTDKRSVVRRWLGGLRSTGLAMIVLGSVPAAACPQLPRDVSARISEQWRQDRLRADVVVVGIFRRAGNETDCGSFEAPCIGRIVAEKVRRGAKLAEYEVAYGTEFNMCDARNVPPPDGARARFYIDGSPDQGYSLVESVWIERR